jgi:uncharacterized protein
MKALVTATALLAASAALALGPPVPRLTGPVVDRADVVDAENRARIEALARDLERRTGAEMAVLTMPSVAPVTAFDYGMQVAEAWKLGKKGRDDGLLMLVVLEPPEVRIFPGYGLEGVLPDGRVGAILDQYVVPEFKRGAYGDGIYAGLAAAASVIAGDAPPRAPPRHRGRSVPLWLVVAAFAALLLFLLAGSAVAVASAAAVASAVAVRDARGKRVAAGGRVDDATMDRAARAARTRRLRVQHARLRGRSL